MYNRVLFIGSKESGFKVLQEMFLKAPHSIVGCVTVDDSEDTRSKISVFRKYCNDNGIPLEVLSGKCDISESINRFTPDLCIVMGWYYIISPQLLDRVRGGFIGVHNSLLPRHRGFAPVVWAMIAGDKETGFSVFSFDTGMDTGDIWYQGKIKILKTDYISDVIEKLDIEICKFFRNSYLDILSGKIKPQKQMKDNFISYGARRTAEDGKIDWNETAEHIYDFIRAQSKPYPGAYTFYRGEKCIIWKSDIFPYPIQGAPGQVGLIDNERKYIVVVCGGSTGLIISEIDMNDNVYVATNVIKSLNYKVGI